MEAKEMFEELGYKEIENDKLLLTYIKETVNKICGTHREVEIQFHKLDHSWSKKEYTKIKFEWISIDEFKAVQKQIEELNW